MSSLKGAPTLRDHEPPLIAEFWHGKRIGLMCKDIRLILVVYMGPICGMPDLCKYFRGRAEVTKRLLRACDDADMTNSTT